MWAIIRILWLSAHFAARRRRREHLPFAPDSGGQRCRVRCPPTENRRENGGNGGNGDRVVGGAGANAMGKMHTPSRGRDVNLQTSVCGNAQKVSTSFCPQALIARRSPNRISTTTIRAVPKGGAPQGASIGVYGLSRRSFSEGGSARLPKKRLKPEPGCCMENTIKRGETVSWEGL